MAPQDDQREARPMNHRHDHIHPKDEAFQYRSTQPKEMVMQFVKENNPAIIILQGFLLLGKTRTSKEFARLLAKQLRESTDCAKEVHTFLFDLKNVESAEKLPSYIYNDICKAEIKGFEFNVIDNVDQLSDAFRKANDRKKAFTCILVLDNIDRVHDRERPKMLDFIQGFAAMTRNVHIVLTSVTDVNLVRDPNMFMKYHLKPLEPDCAKELLRETAGNPEGFDRHADDIIRLVGGSPLALMIAGNEMNKKSTQLPYTPEDFVEVMKDSSSLALHLENSPSDDQLVKRITDIVQDNFSELEKLVMAMDNPQVFTPEDLKDAMAAACGTQKHAWEIKRTVLFVLRKSMYGFNDDNGSAESTPLVIEILKEAFCQMTSKDGFLKDFNSNLVNTIDDTSHLMRSVAKGLRQAEICLLRNHVHQKVQNLRSIVISKACELLRTIGVDEKTQNDFRSKSLHIKKEWEELEAKADRIHVQVGIQESCPNPEGKSVEKELEACISPTFTSNILPNVNESQAVGSSTSSVQAANVESSEETKRVDEPHQQKESGDKEQNASGNTLIAEITRVVSETTVKGQASDRLLSSCSVKTTDTEEGHFKTAHVNKDKCMTNVSCSQASVLSDAFGHFSIRQLSEPGSLHSTDCREPSQESLPLHGTYSALPTRLDNHVLTSSPDVESRKQGDQDIDTGCNGLSRKEATESEFEDWEHEDVEEVGESKEETNANSEPCFTVPQPDRKEHLAGSETNDEGTKPPHLQNIQTAVVTSNPRISNATTTGRQSDILQQSRPQDRRHETRGPGILGLSPAAASFDSHRHPPVPVIPSHNNLALQRNPSSPCMDIHGRYPIDSGFMPASQPIQEQNYMTPGLLQPSNIQVLNNTPYSGSSGHYNHFGREYNERDFDQGPGSLQQSHVQGDRLPNTNYSGGSSQYNHFGREYNQHNFLESHNPSSIPVRKLTKTFDELSLECGPSYSSDMSYSFSDFQQQQSKCVYPPQRSGHPYHSLVSTPNHEYRAQPPSPCFQPRGPPSYNDQSPHHTLRMYGDDQHGSVRNDHHQVRGPPHDIDPSSQNSRLRSRGPSSRFQQSYGAPYQNHVSTPPPQSQVHSPRYRYPQSQGPPFQPRGPPSSVQSPPHTLRTYGDDQPGSARNGPPSGPYQGDHFHRQQSQYQPQSRYDQRNGRY
ncbi:uncharacterized protein LOC121428345 isoform X2 [Lytechinus variegatus]|uniref:uncharacterized protein LOC121428345 isoform X2 n=1 Tax=Lytechinus variegatus TaxID=7654 RepID=UPI001BB27048|nr:uncharacterized protein LOC121428345 isoform X2 [Lytechinus variegatus]